MNRESERKRLVELLSQFERTCPENCTGLEKSCTQCVLEQKADHILDDGWMRPPVKVGQTVYQVTRDFISEFRVRFIEIATCGNLVLHTDLISGIIHTGELFPESEIGKTVFTSREDAEKALKGEDK